VEIGLMQDASIAGLRSIPGDLKYNDAAAMLVVQSREATCINEELSGTNMAAMMPRAIQH